MHSSRSAAILSTCPNPPLAMCTRCRVAYTHSCGRSRRSCCSSWFRVHISGLEHLPADGAAIVAANQQELPRRLLHRDRHAVPRAHHGQGRAVQGPARLVADAPRRVRSETGRGHAGARRQRVPSCATAGWWSCSRRAPASTSPMPSAPRITAPAVSPWTPGRRSCRRRSMARPISGWGRCPSPAASRSHSCRRSASRDRPTADALRDALEDLIDRRVWPAVQDEYGRLQATPGAIAAALAALGLGGGLVARSQRRKPSRPRLLGIVEPRRLRRRSSRRRRLQRLRALRGRRP